MRVIFEASGGGAALKATLTLSEHATDPTILTMEGVLTDSSEDEQALEVLCRIIDEMLDALVVDAQACTIGPRAELLWAQTVSSRLRLVHLSYRDSTLALLMQNCPEYTHEHSHFECS